MSTKPRIMLLAGAVAILVIAFVLLKPGGDSSNSEPAATTPVTTGNTGAVAKPKPSPPKSIKIVVRDAAPVGGVKKIRVAKGDKIRFTVSSDVSDEVHFHGYDVSKPVGPGSPAKFVVPARLDGIFEVELEQRAIPIAEVRVEP